MVMISTKTILLHILITLIAFLVIGEISFRLPSQAMQRSQEAAHEEIEVLEKA